MLPCARQPKRLQAPAGMLPPPQVRRAAMSAATTEQGVKLRAMAHHAECLGAMASKAYAALLIEAGADEEEVTGASIDAYAPTKSVLLAREVMEADPSFFSFTFCKGEPELVVACGGFVLPPRTKVDMRKMLQRTPFGRGRAGIDESVQASIDDARQQRKENAGADASAARDAAAARGPPGQFFMSLRAGGAATEALRTAAAAGTSMREVSAHAALCGSGPAYAASAANTLAQGPGSSTGDARRGVKRHLNGVPVEEAIRARAELHALAERVRTGGATLEEVARLR